MEYINSGQGFKSKSSRIILIGVANGNHYVFPNMVFYNQQRYWSPLLTTDEFDYYFVVQVRHINILVRET